MNRNLLFVAALMMTIVLALAGCAKKGNPTEPGATQPERVPATS
jgi:predicted small lipoprotein YifL